MKKNQPLPTSTPAATPTGNFLLSLVIPCYNESGRVDLMLQGLADFQSKWKGDYEVIIVDDGSKDDTVAKVQQAIAGPYAQLKDRVRVVAMPANGGKGSALRKGVEVAEGQYILTLDADMSTKPAELLNWMKREKNLFDGNNTIYIGSRKHAEGKVEALQSRRIIGSVFNGIVQVFTSLQLKDTQCGFKLYPAAVAKFLFGGMRSNGWVHDVEVLYQADLNGIGIVEMPINWVNQPESKVNVVKDSIMMFFGILAISMRLWLSNTFVLPFRMPPTADSAQRGQIIGRSVFNMLAILLLIAMPAMSFQFAITGDEHWHFDYGNSIYNYFFKGDTEAQTATSGIQFYGGLFDFITAFAYNVFHIWDHYTTMHFINALVGAVGIIYAGKLAKMLGGWPAAIIAVLFLVFSPSWFGHNFANPKDIPFSVGYTAGIYFILLFLKSLPNPNAKHLVGLIGSIGWAMGVRIGGLLLIAYLGLFLLTYVIATRQLKAVATKKTILQLAIVVIAGYLIAIVCWPYAHLGIIEKPLEALKVMSNFFVNIGMLYEGKKIVSNQVPWYYIPKYLAYTAPLIVLAGFALGVLGLPTRFKDLKNYLLPALFILFTCFFPLAYAIYKKSSLYDGWRHFLFIYPPMVAIAAAGWAMLMQGKNKAVKYAVAAVVTIGLLPPARFAIANHTFESLYYNEVAGGLKNIYGKYETDYYMMGIKPAAKWLVEHEQLANKKVVVATNCTYPLLAYMEPYKGIAIAYVRYYERYSKDWDYCILFSRFVDASQLTTGNWPPPETIHTITVDGVPIAAVLKRKTKKDFEGFELLKAKKVLEAKERFVAALAEYPDNDLAWEAMADIYNAEGKYDSAIYAGYKALRTYPGSISIYEMMGNTFMRQRMPDSAMNLFKKLEVYNPGYSHFFIGYAYATMGNAASALAEIDAAIAADPYNQQAYKLGIQIAQQTKNNAKVEEYYDKAKRAFPEQEGEK